MKENKTMIILGIVAILAIIGLVLLFNWALTGKVVTRYPAPFLAKQYPTSVARLHCELPEPRLDLTAEQCRRIGWQQCAEMHGSPNRITVCQQHCGFEIANLCRKAHGTKGIGLKYTYEPRMGLRRPVNE